MLQIYKKYRFEQNKRTLFCSKWGKNTISSRIYLAFTNRYFRHGINIAKKLILENQQMVKELSFIRRNVEFEPHSCYVLVGLRRAGKSYMLYQRIHDLLQQGHSIEEILYFNFEDDRLADIQLSDLDLIKQAYEELFTHKPIFMMLDEIQLVDGWEKFARRLADHKYLVYITGSNAKMLSKEISTTLDGRYIVQNVFPFSFMEFLQSKNIQLEKQWEYLDNVPIKRTFNEYFHFGGLPELVIREESFKRQWLGNLYNKIYFGDLISRYNIRNTTGLKVLVRKLAESIKQPQSYNRLANIVSTVAGKVKQETIVDYLEYIKETCMIFSIENIEAKLQDKISNKKYYFIDNGILNLFLLDPETSLLENMVAIYLYETYGEDLYYYNDNIEVDFCLFEHGKAIQVSYSIQDDKTYERETKALLAYAKRFDCKELFIITMDEEKEINLDGNIIQIIPLWKMLLKGV